MYARRNAFQLDLPTNISPGTAYKLGYNGPRPSLPSIGKVEIVPHLRALLGQLSSQFWFLASIDNGGRFPFEKNTALPSFLAVQAHPLPSFDSRTQTSPNTSTLKLSSTVHMFFGGLEFIALHHFGAWLGTHIAAGATHGALTGVGHAITSQTAAHAGNVFIGNVVTEAAKNVGTSAASNFWTWVGTLL
jgi:hypothetical protein